MHEVFIQLSVTLGIALILSLVMKVLKQPLIIAYIVAGIIVGPAVTGMISHTENLEGFSHIGVALLLFIVGLGLKPKVIRDVGIVAIFTGLGQIVFTSIVGYGIARLLNFEPITAFYLAIAFSLSSTIVILRLLYLKEEQDTLYGRITIGCLLVQDIVAMFFFIILSSTATIGTGNFVPVILGLFGKVIIVLVSLYLLMKFITPKIDKLFAESQELLFVFSIGVCFVVSTIFYKLGFSLELGALVAGVMLSLSPYQREIAMKIQSLRDFFLIIFFIIMGTNIVIADLQNAFLPIIIFSIFILIGNPLILILIMRAMRYTIKTSFFAGISIAQISEFSLIILTMGVALGHIPRSILALATLIGLITIAFSTYFITYNQFIYKRFRTPLEKVFSDEKSRKEKREIKSKFDVILFGCHVMGAGLIKQMQKMKMKFLAVDHDPKIVEGLEEQNISSLYGSADDTSLLDSLPIKRTKLIISTIPDVETNLFLISYLKRFSKNIKFICISNHFTDAEKLYKNGATYVVMPPYLGRRFVVELFKKNKFDLKKYQNEKTKHIFDLNYLEGKNGFVKD